MGFGRDARRVLVADGSNSPPVCYSLPSCSNPFGYGTAVPIFVGLSSRGGDDGIRTHDPLLVGQVLSQLSYTPILLGLL